MFLPLLYPRPVLSALNVGGQGPRDLMVNFEETSTNDLHPRLRILFVNGTSEIGGADTDLLEITRHLDKRRFDPIVVLPYPGLLTPEFEAGGIRLVYLDAAPIKRFDRFLQYIAYPLRWIRAATKLFLLIRREKCALVQVNSSVLPAVGFAARLAGIPCVWHVREITVNPAAVGQLLRIWIAICSNRIVANSQAVAVPFNRLCRNKVIVIPHGIDLVRFSPGERRSERQKLGVPPEGTFLGYVGRLSPGKGISILFEALSKILPQMPDVRLIVAASVVGYTKHLEELRDLARRLGIADRIFWRFDERNVTQVMRALDVLVVPSVVPESFGLVAIEGLACGCAVIGTNHGGLAEILNRCPAGRLAPPGDPSALAGLLRDLLIESSLHRRDLDIAARQWAVQHYDIERATRALAQVYESLSPITAE